MDYDLEQLGETAFQDLVASLVVATLGPDVEVMGAGPDGGRDLYIEVPFLWEAGQPTEELWDGRTVFQVKHKAKLAAQPTTDAAWLWTEVRKELEKWADVSSNRNPVPDQLVFITNVDLTPMPLSGGHDRLRDNVRQYLAALRDSSRDVGDGSERRSKLARLERIRKVRFWDGNKLNALLDAHQGVRSSIPAFLTATDVFAYIRQLTGGVADEDLERVLRMHARSCLMSDGLIYFADAGYGDSSGLQVHEVAVDLPIVDDPDRADVEKGRDSLIQFVLRRAERLLKPSTTTTSHPRHIILKGDPGNGKSTISRLLVQAYRCSFIGGPNDLSEDQRGVLQGTTRFLRRLGPGLPRHRRWPIRIDLAEYAQERGHLLDDSMIHWVAEKVSARVTLGSVSPRSMDMWRKRWPWLVIFDGLDEVTEPSTRRRVLERVVDFVNEAEADDCDILVIMTTRPIGYSENVAPGQFSTVTLADLSAEEALAFGRRVTSLRLRDDVDRVRTVIRHLEDAAASETLRYLLRTPLQVLILSIIIENTGGNMPPDRYSLFWGYYSAVFNRERAKPTSFRSLLQDHAPRIQELHEQVGYQLHLRAERGDASFAAIESSELRVLAGQILYQAGYKMDPTTDHLVDEIIRAATQRLVLISPRGEHGFGFDVRSLQELMAALHIGNASPQETTRRLRHIAASPHWRNAWLFAAGRIFAANQRFQMSQLVEIVESIDHNAAWRLGGVVPIGPRIALEILDDGMVRASPVWRDRLLAHALRVLREPTPTDLPDLARSFVSFADGGNEQRSQLAEGIRSALSGCRITRETTAALQGLIPAAEAQLAVRKATKGLAAVRRRMGDGFPAEPLENTQAFDEEVLTAPLTQGQRRVIEEAAASLRSVMKGGRLHGDPVRAALRDASVAAVLQAALVHVLPGSTRLYVTLRDDFLPDVCREPISGIESTELEIDY